jgi:hypothetical protein
MAREKITLSRAEIQMTFANWIDANRADHPDYDWKTPAQYTDTFIKHIPQRAKL